MFDQSYDAAITEEVMKGVEEVAGVDGGGGEKNGLDDAGGKRTPVEGLYFYN